MPATITVIPQDPIAPISPHLHGHFTEHLGTCINNGIWVGHDSPIPNTAGLRDDLLAALRAIHPPVIRWPGGCFADDYDWEDGVGPPRNRPARVNAWWGCDLENNAFGTHEFINFCRLVGAQPYLAGNMGSGSVREMRDWVEYCNFDKPSTLARRRAANGSPLPFNVRYWGVGNEPWGCGGNFCAADYAREYRRYATYLRDYGDCPLFLIAAGPDGNNLDWTRTFFSNLAMADQRFNCRIHGYAAHYYCGTAGQADEFSTDQWYQLLHRAAAIEQLILDQRSAMDEFDPQRKVGLIIDEWGTWHHPTPGRNPHHLFQPSTLRDALVAAITLDTFHRHADKLVMANVAQLANVLQALFHTHEDKLILTPTYHVFDLYKEHQNAQAIRMEIEAPSVNFADGQTKRSLPTLAGSASLAGDILTLTITSAHARIPIEAEIHLPPSRAFEGLQLTHDHLNAQNTLESPEELIPKTIPVNPPAHVFPPASITRLQFRINR